jgi:hypothetical protein
MQDSEVPMKLKFIVASGVVLLLCACTQRQVGTLKGTVNPSERGTQITIVQNGTPVASLNAADADGTFSADVKAGVYTVMITSPASSLPVIITDVTVKAGETTMISPVNMAVQTGKAIVTGRITPVRPGTKVKLISEGRERAAVHIGADGKYEFRELPAGNYAILAEAPGYAEDTSPLTISSVDQKTEQNLLLLPITATAGVDWASGKIRATGHGLPPAQAPNSTVRREMTRRAALSDAQRNLIRTVENIRISSTLDIKKYMNDASHAERIQGFIRGYTVARETERDDGSIDMILELPLTGPAGLSRFITE